MSHNQNNDNKNQQDAAVEVIRGKLDVLYGKEPSAREEIKKIADEPPSDLSKHQRYMRELGTSGRSLAEIQTAWHEYYQQLPEEEKHQVWHEFYAAHEKKKQTPAQPEAPEKPEPAQTRPASSSQPIKRPAASAKDIKDSLINRVSTRRKVSKKHHLHSLAFGLGMGSLVIVFLLFSFFNERFITPFIRPSHNISASSIIVDPNASGPVGPEAKIIIPKINVEAPVVYDEPSIEESAVQKALERGVVHYAITPNPGEQGNAVIFGHSSSNIFNSGKYKFAFLLLKSLEKDDTFIVQKDGKKYVYKVYEKFVTSPEDISVLNPTAKPATMTLITCDPPGLSTNRLIIRAEQIYPSPDKNPPSQVANIDAVEPEILAGNAPSLWQRVKNWFASVL